MYKISGIVKDGQLGAAVQALHGLVDEVSVTPMASVVPVSPEQRAAIQSFDAGKKPVIHGRKVMKRKSFKRDGSLQNAALELIGQIGVPPFKLLELAERAATLGIQRPALIRALDLEMKAGRMVRLSKGIYQRKGAAVAQSAGIGQLA